MAVLTPIPGAPVAAPAQAAAPSGSGPSCSIQRSGSLWQLGIEAQELTTAIGQLAERLETDDTDVRQQALAELEAALLADEGNKAAIAAKADATCWVIEHLRGQAAYRQQQAKRLTELSRSDANRADALEDSLILVLTRLQPTSTRFSFPNHELSSRKSQAVCQATSKTGPEATRKLGHPGAGSASPTEPLTASSGKGLAELPSAHTAGPVAGLEGVMQTPEEVAVMRQLLERGWSQRRIARELGISRHTVSRYRALGTWQPYDSRRRSGQLAEYRQWLQQQFEQHHGNAEVVRQELLKHKGIEVSLRTVERAVQTWRQALRQSRQATVRYETRPGQQLQADFGELWVLIGGVRTKVHLCVLTLGYSRRQVVRVFRQQRQRHWLQALEEAFRIWDGVPEQVLVDNAKALVTLHNPSTGELVINPVFAAFARHWGFTPKACWPHRPQTKGKDERGVGYVKRSGLAGHRFDTWGQMEGHLDWWNREIADLRIHGTTGEKPLERFQRSEAGALLPLNGRPSYLAEQEFSRRVAKDCCVQVEGNWYSVPAALVRQNVTVQIRDQQVLIRQGGRIVARHSRQSANQRSRQVIAGHWEGLIPQRAIDAAQADNGALAAVVELDVVRRSSLARPLSDYAAVVAEVG